MKKYKSILDLGPRQLWKLRKQIILNSVYLPDYINEYDIPEEIVFNFFDGWLEYCDNLIQEKYGDPEDYNFWLRFKEFDDCKCLNEYRDTFR